MNDPVRDVAQAHARLAHEARAAGRRVAILSGGELEVTAVSIHAYAHLLDKYALLPHGASIGDNYGPVVVSRETHAADDLSKLKIAVPGKLTSA
mgnify:CR=1 FL=1